MSSYAEVLFNLPGRCSFTYLIPDTLSVEPGMRVVAPFKNRSRTGVISNICKKPPEGIKGIKALERSLDPAPLYPEGYLELAGWVAEMYICSLGEALFAMVPSGRREKALDIPDGTDFFSSNELELDLQQKEALDGIKDNPEGWFYLFGVTGSGKTEVYIRAAEYALSEGKSIIYLVPEISLANQTLSSLRSRFGNNLAVIHSGLTPSQKLTEWRRIRNGEAKVVLGPRSAVFAPVSHLGLLIIDEEHDGAYKSGSTPRYNARQVAMYRAGKNKARLIMGSATPSMEAYHLIEKRRIIGFRMEKRLAGGHMPRVEIVDMKKARPPISEQLEQAIRETHRQGRQTILFLNRRGFSYFFHCRTCGYEMRCRNCSVSLTYHKEKELLLCHYCGYYAKPISVCPECGSLDVGYSGFGTQRIEEEIRTMFPEMRVGRIDTDAVRKKGALQKTMQSFRKGEIDILLGTQMVAKGLNFPSVKLVGIINADTGLMLPDFRSEERVFSLILQVSGRAGRFFPDGEVVIQTFRPENKAILYAAEAKVEAFYNQELDMRRQLHFPPFTRLIRIVIRGSNMEEVLSDADMLAEKIEKAAKQNGKASNTEILGPAECPIAVIARKYRFQIIVRSENLKCIHRIVSGVVTSANKKKSVYREIDIDPVHLL